MVTFMTLRQSVKLSLYFVHDRLHELMAHDPFFSTRNHFPRKDSISFLAENSKWMFGSKI